MKSFACFNLSANPFCVWTDHFLCHTRNTKSPAKSLCFTKEQKKYASEPFKSESARVLVACTRNFFLWIPPLFSCRRLNILRSGPKAILEWIHVWNFQPMYCFFQFEHKFAPKFSPFLVCFCWESTTFSEYIDKVHTFWLECLLHLKPTRKKTFCWGCRSNIF